MNSVDKQHLRRHFRTQRKALTKTEQRQAQSNCCKRLIANPYFQKAEKIAFYLANDGEVSPACALNYAQKMGKTCYLPVITTQGSLQFAAVDKQTQFKKNQFGIEEPANTEQVAATSLDLILLPLVAFDESGNRLGMGGGYYDKSLASVQPKPRLIGLAHQCQKAEQLPADSWDIKIDDIIAV